MEDTTKALRYNSNKTRIELVPTELIDGVARVLTYGANKYTVKDEEGNIVSSGAENWRRGLSWMSVVASLKRHLESFVNGEDYDKESFELHLSHCATNIAFLLSYYKIHPELDDRPHNFTVPKKFALDLDDVCVEYIEAWCELHGQPIPTAWSFDRAMKDKFTLMMDRNELEKFYLNLKPKIDPSTIPFEPVAYVTSRPVSSAISEQWLDAHGFPAAPVYTVGFGESKLETLKSLGIQYFVDDNYTTYKELNANGICCYLMDALHNQRYSVGFKRIKSLLELK